MGRKAYCIVNKSYEYNLIFLLRYIDAFREQEHALNTCYLINIRNIFVHLCPTNNLFLLAGYKRLVREPRQGIQRNFLGVLVVNVFVFLKVNYFCFVVVIFDLVHDVEAIRNIC